MQNVTSTAKGVHIAWTQLRPRVVFGYKSVLLVFGIFLVYEAWSVRLKQVLSVITTTISPIFSNQENATFDLVSIAILLCSFLSMGLIFVPVAFLWCFIRCMP
ncbi:hypothetical protein RRG08_031726 [Elysia crispata]|uniref:Uncharacterized protein n=1 Tax=Elysia crispata TaxID=231223 RepID=A0AAE0ZEZ2_9GAST|nr:hypothetical protein RRG08_031726 [Elysia crispata]